MKTRIVKIGSRESKLAVIQSRMVMELIERHHPEIRTELITMKTTGDMILDRTLDKIGGKGLFVKELDKALLAGEIDLSVHSLKDMPMEVSLELPLLAYSKREIPADVLVLPEGITERDESLPIGSSSMRRNLQLAEIYPGCTTKSVRGNVLTRLSKLDGGEYGALVLAYAGLERLGLSHRISYSFSPDEMVPAAGQGILAIQGRAGEDHSYLDCLNDEKAQAEALAERAFVRFLDGGCSSPIGAFAEAKEDEIHIRGLYFEETARAPEAGEHSGNGGIWRTGDITGPVLQAEELAQELARRLRDRKNNGGRK